MPSREQTQPKEPYIHVYTGLMPESAYRVKTADIMAMAGYSKTLARRLIAEGRVWDVVSGWVKAGEEFIIDFLDGPVDGNPIFGALCIQTNPYYEGWTPKSRAIFIHARNLDWDERLRLWLCRHVSFLDRDWVLPKKGEL